MPKLTARKSRKARAATPAERRALSFTPVPITFQWNNEEWARTHLPMVRLAAALLSKDRAELKEAVGNAIKKGVMPAMLDGLTVTKGQLMGLADLIDNALTRQFLVLEEMGYSPENPPPDHSEKAPHLAIVK